MKKLMMLVLICASIFTSNRSYASANDLPSNKSSKSAKTHTVSKSQVKVQKGRRNKRQHGYNYYKYANSHSYLRYMGKAINGR